MLHYNTARWFPHRYSGPPFYFFPRFLIDTKSFWWNAIWPSILAYYPCCLVLWSGSCFSFGRVYSIQVLIWAISYFVSVVAHIASSLNPSTIPTHFYALIHHQLLICCPLLVHICIHRLWPHDYHIRRLLVPFLLMGERYGKVLTLLY